MSTFKDQPPIALALLRAKATSGDGLAAALIGCGMQVAVEESLTAFAGNLSWQHRQFDALLLDLQDADEADFERLDTVLERSTLPLIFHDGAVRLDDDFWLQRLASKIRDAVSAHHANKTGNRERRPPSLRCWVLGASFGGPEALQRFLGAISTPPPALAFIIGQHIGDGFVDVLAEQLSRSSVFKVTAARDGDVLEAGRVYVAPVQEQLLIAECGRIRLQRHEEKHTYLPSIDHLMTEVAQRFGVDSGAIVFSGMGDDGARGSVVISRAGGPVWAQSADSCACDSMPNCTAATGAVSFQGTPEELANRFVDHFAASAAIARTHTA